MHHIKLQQFEGPFDLLLSLIEKQKLDISLISLTQIVDDYVHLVEEQTPREKSEFVLLATRLLYIKACVLAKIHIPEEETQEQSTLVQQLVAYKQYKDAAVHLEHLFSETPKMVGKRVEKIVGYQWPTEATPASMVDTYVSAISQLKRLLVVPQKSVRPTITLKEAHTRLSTLISQKPQLIFQHALTDCQDSTHVAVYFLAFLHMISTKQVDYEQSGLFCDIMVRAYANHTAVG